MPTHFPYLIDPSTYPDYERRQFRVPTWDTFGNRTQFTALREMPQTSWREDLDRYTEEFRLGNVIWPPVRLLYSPHIDEIIEEVQRRGLYLFDFSGYVPGSPMEAMCSNIVPPPGAVAHLRQALGERFLGIDNGEQDGRYIHATAERQCPSPLSREEQYLMFQRHFQKLCDELGNQMTALVSLCFGHYFLKEGNHLLLGAETAQSLPCSQIYYAFIRGACKQYGVLWFGNASCWNRWGWKEYGPEKMIGRYLGGPEHGSSLALLKRLLYSHYLYNSVAVGFEIGWLKRKDLPAGAQDHDEWELSPIGKIQAEAARFVDKHGQPGVMHAPVALLLDFFAGWAPPRHLYSKNVYQVWGGMPYGAGDYLTHGVLGLFYPGYEDASYYRDERGFLTPTPFGDMVDCLLSDAQGGVFAQYGLLIAAGELRITAELRDKILAYVEGGGSLVVTGENARGLFLDLEIGERPLEFPGGSVVTWLSGEGEDTETAAFGLLPIELPSGVEVLAVCEAVPAVVRLRRGAGFITVALSPFGLPWTSVIPPGTIDNAEEEPLACPFPLLAHVARLVTGAAAVERLFSVGEELGYVTCRKGAGSYTLGIWNSRLDARPFAIASHCGAIRSVEELAIDQSEKELTGYWPAGIAADKIGRSDVRTIAGGDVRIFAVEVEESGVTELPLLPVGAAAGRWFVRLPREIGIQDAILRSPTFFHRYRGVKADWSYLRMRDRAELRRESGWLRRQRVQVIVDFSSGLNLYPNLTILDAYEPHFEESMRQIDDVMDKMLLLEARDMLITLHRKPENHWPDARAHDGFVRQLRELCRRAMLRGLTVHLQAHRGRWVTTTAEAAVLVDEVAAPNLRIAINTGHAIMVGEDLGEAITAVGDRLGSMLLSAPQRDQLGQWYDAHLPISGQGVDLAAVREVSTRDDVLLILDAAYESIDEAYSDLVEVDGRRKGTPWRPK